MTNSKLMFSQVCHQVGLLSFRMNMVEEDLQTAIELLCASTEESPTDVLRNTSLRNKAEIWCKKIKVVFPELTDEVNAEYDKLDSIINSRNDLIHAAAATINTDGDFAFKKRERKVIQTAMNTIPLKELQELVYKTEEMWLWLGSCINYIDKNLGYPR